jgi:hypothetical protein
VGTDRRLCVWDWAAAWEGGDKGRARDDHDDNDDHHDDHHRQGGGLGEGGGSGGVMMMMMMIEGLRGKPNWVVSEGEPGGGGGNGEWRVFVADTTCEVSVITLNRGRFGGTRKGV